MEGRGGVRGYVERRRMDLGWALLDLNPAIWDTIAGTGWRHDMRS